MTMQEHRDEPIVIRLSTSGLELPLDLSRRVWEEAARRGTTPELLVTQLIGDMLRQMDDDPSPASERDVDAADRNGNQTENLQGDTSD